MANNSCKEFSLRPKA